jgi:hypothetical protein
MAGRIVGAAIGFHFCEQKLRYSTLELSAEPHSQERAGSFFDMPF